jgi:hypothetical protein
MLRQLTGVISVCSGLFRSSLENGSRHVERALRRRFQRELAFTKSCTHPAAGAFPHWSAGPFFAPTIVGLRRAVLAAIGCIAAEIW